MEWVNMRRIRIKDITAATGLSRSTVDRVLNARGGVHKKSVEAVTQAVHRLTTVNPDTGKLGHSFDLILRLGQGTTNQIRQVFETEYGGESTLHDMSQCTDRELAGLVTSLAEFRSRPIIIAAMNSPLLADALAGARREGIHVTAIISDLTRESRDAYVGIDNRTAGQTAAFLVGKTLGDRPTAVGVVVGDPAFRCHEDRESGFRTALRLHFPKVVLAGEAHGDDNREKTRTEVLSLLERQPAIAALYNVGGGNPGLVEAVKRAGRADDLLIISHEANNVTLPLLHNGSLDFVLAQNPGETLKTATSLGQEGEGLAKQEIINLDFSIFTKFNFPKYARQQFVAGAGANTRKA
jgi:LacI family transcriptional regulator, galactose operon repressor